MFALFLEFGVWTRPQDLSPFLISETGMKFLIVWTQGEIHPGNRAHVKRPLVTRFFWGNVVRVLVHFFFTTAHFSPCIGGR